MKNADAGLGENAQSKRTLSLRKGFWFSHIHLLC